MTFDIEDKDICKKKVTAKVRFTANIPGNIQYTLKNKNGRIIANGVAQTNKVGNGYVAKSSTNFESGAYNGVIRLEAKDHPKAFIQRILNVKCLEPVKGGHVAQC